MAIFVIDVCPVERENVNFGTDDPDVTSVLALSTEYRAEFVNYICSSYETTPEGIF